jgi:MFS family permease
MTSRRWLRIIPVALIMYTISYVDRTNLNLALSPTISTMMHDLGMTDTTKGRSFGIFFFGYIVLQIPGGYLATHWSPRKVISLCLVGWGLCAMACGMVRTVGEFEVARFFLGAAESAVFPAMLVLLSNWFPRAELGRANAYWNLCQPLAIVTAALLTGALLQGHSWRTAIILEGVLPFVWLPIWWFLIRDRPSEAKWISPEEREHLETTLRAEAAAVEKAAPVHGGKEGKTVRFPIAPILAAFCQPLVLVLIIINFLHNSLAYGCMSFFTATFEGHGYSAMQNGWLYALPFTVTAVLMVVVSRHSDKTNERRMHVAITYVVSGVCLIISASLQGHFWWSYFFMCLSIPGPSVALAPFWSIPSETLPQKSRGAVMGLVNACGNLGGFVGPAATGWLKEHSHNLALPFDALGFGILIAAGFTFLLPKTAPRPTP